MRDTDFLGAGDPGALETLLGSATAEGARIALFEAYCRWGWLAANLDPLGLNPPTSIPELDPAGYGLPGEDAASLRRSYCGSLGWEFGHLQDADRREWIAGRAEAAWSPSTEDRQAALNLIAQGEMLEAIFDRRMPGAKTFGLSGAEGFLVLLERVLGHGASAGADEAVIGGMHRGRLTQMGLVFGKPLDRIIADAKGIPEYPAHVGASSDSPYHLGWQGSVETSAGPLDIWVAPHPSHLSVVAPVAMGYARARIEKGKRVLPISLHTDAAVAGQGINAELFQLSGLPPYDVGGTIHLILNNQVGFTTSAEAARTARTCADIAKLIEAPILHVNGDDPDAILRAAETVVAWREAFHSDIVVELIAYRRKGHNEIDQPRFTQPEMYARIDALPPLSRRYGEYTGAVSDAADFAMALDRAFEAARDLQTNDIPEAPGLAPDIEARMLEPVATGLAPDTLRHLGVRITELPEHIVPHPKVAEFVANRRFSLADGAAIDWSTAEALAIASLAGQGIRVKLSGQDSVRGAFTQRHMRVHSQASPATHCVFDSFDPGPMIENTPLAENAVLAFDYGLSVGRPDDLTIWEAQFGDFLNVAQAIFDQFIICGEDRWLFRSNLVLLLPHGVDGGGPDHATAHPERLLAACARGNVQVANPSTPANYFHLLRRQVLAPWRKPLAVLAPKTLLRHPGARSSLRDFEGFFRTVLSEDRTAKRIVMSCGKLAVLLAEARDKRGLEDVSLIRLEQFYPLDRMALTAALAPYADAELIWAQEEPENLGYFGWLDRRLEEISGRRWRLVSRPASPSASAGPKQWDDARLQAVIDEALEG